MLFIIPTLMLLKIPHICKDSENSKIIKKSQFLSQMCLYYFVVLHHEAEKTMQVDKFDPKEYKHALLHHIKVYFCLFIKGVFVHFLLNIWVQFVWFMLSN